MRALMVVVLLAGCVGGDGGSVPEEGLSLRGLPGTWIVRVPGPRALSCLAAFTFTESGSYVEEFVCQLPSGVIAREVITGGEYEVDGSTIELVPMGSSCPDADAEPFSYSYSFEAGDRLKLTGRGGLVLFERLPESDGGSGVEQFGCFNEDGEFIQRELAPI